jgi:tRNA threonylcarbamoyladenosine modification (KEOPS) complex  Pcc1 subunit
MSQRRKPNAYAILRITLKSKRQINALYSALKPELMHPAGKKAQATILTRGRTLKLVFQAKDSSTLRAIFSSYLRMLAASLKVSDALIEMESS